MKLYLSIVLGLLLAAALVSLVLDNWDVLIAVAIGLAFIVAGDLAFGWSRNYSEETERHRERWLGRKATEPTYYYDEGEEAPDSDSPDGKNTQK